MKSIISRQWLIWWAIGLFGLAASMKALNLMRNFPGSSELDNVIWFLPSNVLAVFMIGLEVWIVTFLLSKQWRLYTKFAALLIVSSCFLGYRGINWIHFGMLDCGCFGIPKENAILYAFFNVFGFLGISIVFLGSILSLIVYSSRPSSEDLSAKTLD